MAFQFLGTVELPEKYWPLDGAQIARAKKYQVQTVFRAYAFQNCTTLKLSKLLPRIYEFSFRVSNSVTRFGDLLYFGQLFKAWGNNYFAKIANTY